MRKGFRRLVVALVVVLLGAGGALLARNFWEQYRRDMIQRAIEVLPEAAHWIRDFHRTSVRDGRKEWEVAAREARYYDEQELVVVRDPLLSFYFEDGREVALRGREGRVYLDDRDLERVELEGEIIVELEDYSLRTKDARYEHDSETIFAPGGVEIIGEQLTVRGREMRVEIGSKRVRLQGVETVLHPEA